MSCTHTVTRGVSVFRLSTAYLTSANSSMVRDRLLAAIAEGERQMIIDLSSVERIDVSGVRALLTILKAVGAGGELVVVAKARQVVEVLSIAHVDRFLRICGSIDNALSILIAKYGLIAV